MGKRSDKYWDALEYADDLDVKKENKKELTDFKKTKLYKKAKKKEPRLIKKLSKKVKKAKKKGEKLLKKMRRNKKEEE